ncbi:MAG: alanine--tRNA ligase-related protein, partial [Desulfatirhabdiaceae bacterium]
IVRDVIRDERMTVDMDGFDSAMETQRTQSRSVLRFASAGEAFKSLSARGIRPEFVGYSQLSCTASVLVLAKDGQPMNLASEGQDIEVVVDRTPFYGESGGQMGDSGTITGMADNAGLSVRISDTIKDPSGLIIHRGTVISGTIHEAEIVTLTIDAVARDAIACNHTATHILHAALQAILGKHVKQAGSLVGPDRLRFDFTHFSQVEPDDLEKIEGFVNSRIRENVDVAIEEMDAEDAFKTGAMALFEEKYGDRVRVISLSSFSKELCGGTHTTRTGNIGAFKILSESSVAAGVRRIEAVTGDAAILEAQKTSRMLSELSALLKIRPDDMAVRIEKLLSRQKMLEKEIEALKIRMASESVDTGDSGIQDINGVHVLVKKVAVDSPASLRELGDRLRNKIQSGIVILGSESDGKALLLALVTKDLTSRFHAGNIVKAIASVVGGSGGGRPDMAQAGGTQPENMEQALEKAIDLIRK